MDKYEAYKRMIEITESMKGTSFEVPLQMATDALLEKIQREEDSCESCKINPVKDEVKKVVEG